MDALAASIDSESKPKEKPMSHNDYEEALKRMRESGFLDMIDDDRHDEA